MLSTVPDPTTTDPSSANSHRPQRGLALRSGLRGRLRTSETGAATAEYVIATMAAVGFAGLLVIIMRGDEVRGMLTDLVRNALTLVS